MAFDEVQFPTGISYGSRGGPGWQTFILELDSGAEERVSRRSQPRHSYNARFGVDSYDDLASVRTFFMARRGAARGFRYKDWVDFTSASNGRDDPTYLDQEIGAGDDTTTEFQLVKSYVSGAVSFLRTIAKPVSGTVLIAFDGVQQTSGWSVNTATGMVTFSVAPPSSVNSITAGFEFDVPVRFGKEIDQGLFVSLDDFESGSIPDIPIVELINEEAVSEEAYHGGAYEHGTVSADMSIAESQGRFQVVEPDGAYKIKMPSADGIEPGGPIFFIANEGTSTCYLANSAGSNFFTLVTGAIAEVLLSVNSAGVKTWYGK